MFLDTRMSLSVFSIHFLPLPCLPVRYWAILYSTISQQCRLVGLCVLNRASKQLN